MGKYLQEFSGMIHEVLRKEYEKKKGRERVEETTKEYLVELLS
jgi:hypothetical protein